MTTGEGKRLGWPKCECYWTDRADYIGEGNKTAEDSNFGTDNYRGRIFYRITDNQNCPIHGRG